jgi:hypothetical protein
MQRRSAVSRSWTAEPTIEARTGRKPHYTLLCGEEVNGTGELALNAKRLASDAKDSSALAGTHSTSRTRMPKSYETENTATG